MNASAAAHASTMTDANPAAAAAAAAAAETSASPRYPDNRFSVVDDETRAVMQSRVGEKARDTYERGNIKFLVWLFDNHEDYSALLKPRLLEELKAQHEIDQGRTTAAGRPCKLRDYVRNTCREWLRKAVPGRPETHPIELADLEFVVFARFLATFKKQVAKRPLGGGAEGGTVAIRLGASAFGGACSSLSHLYLECGLDKTLVSKKLWSLISVYNKGSNRTAAKERKNLGLSTVEGKKHLPFAAYRLLAKILFESEKAEHIHAHTFLVLEWNLISRAEYVVDANIDLVSFTKDALLFDMTVTKTDQEGTKNVDHPWHVYSCPEYPEICAHLAFARHLLANPLILNGQTELFEGSSQYERFNAIFRGIVRSPEYRDEFASHGISPVDFGTHSIRKGAATHIATGSTACPPIASICLRANWALPGVLSQYIKFENAGDQFVGKCVSGRRRNKKTFAASPPYWDFSADGPELKEESENTLHSWLRDRLPDQAKNNHKIFAVHKMAIAAITHHRQYLDSHLHPDSILRSTQIWSEDIPFAEKVVSKHPWDSTDETPEITGIPPDIVLLAEMEGMQRKVADLLAEQKASFESMLVNELDRRDVGGSGFAHGNEIISKLENLLQKVSEVSLRAQTSTVVPSVPLLYDDQLELGESGGYVSAAEEEEEEDIVLELDEPQRMAPRNRARIIRERTKEQLKKRKIMVGFHHGRFNPLPASWRYPSGLTVIQLINLWLIGSEKEHVPPLHRLPTSLISHIDKYGRTRSKMKTVMKEVEHFARLDGVWVDGRWTGPAVVKMWSKIWPRLQPFLRTQTTRKNGSISVEKSRQGQIAWRTCYNKLTQQGKQWQPSNNNV